MRVLDLFSGIGGFSLGLERAGMETVAFCEIDPFCQKVLRKHWPEVPIYDDIRRIREQFTRTVDVICGGFPCQPFSVAGKQKGQDDDRHLWPSMFDLIKNHRPSWVIGENVAGLINMGLDDVLADLEGENYTCRTFVIPACAVNAPHRRDRVWIIAHRNGPLQHAQNCASANEQDGDGKIQRWAKSDSAVNATNTHDKRCERGEQEPLQRQSDRTREFAGGNPDWRTGWPISSPRVCGVDDGIPNRTHRLRALGNAVVPQIPEIIGRAIMDIELNVSMVSMEPML